MTLALEDSQTYSGAKCNEKLTLITGLYRPLYNTLLTLLMLSSVRVAICLYLINITFFNSLVWLPKHDLLRRNHYLEFRIKAGKVKKKNAFFNMIILTVIREICRALSLQAHS